MISKKLLRLVGQTNAKYAMFEDGDKILLGLSGGKDSMVLAHILKHFSSVSPLKWSFQAPFPDILIGGSREASRKCNKPLR